ncbi:MAG: phosphoribosylanthranilate isomerase [Desulfotomaculales bacterium]
MVRVKICGTRDAETALAAVAAGADALGFVFAPGRRRVAPGEARAIVAALPPFALTVGVFVDAPLSQVLEIADLCRLHAVQLHGREPPEYCRAVPRPVIRAFHLPAADEPLDEDEAALRAEALLAAVKRYDPCAVLLDTGTPDRPGGTGRPGNWAVARLVAARRPVVLAGGLNPDNVAEAVRHVRPYGVDVSSGVETDGRKDPQKILAFVARARQAPYHTGEQGVPESGR